MDGKLNLANRPDDNTEMFRKLYAALGADGEGGVIGVTSALSGEGRTTVALGLARTLARDVEGSLLVVEADLSRPSLGTLLDLPPSPGLSSVLRGECSLGATTQVTAEGLCVIQAGVSGRDTPRLLRRLAGWNPFVSARVHGRVIIVDLPPILNEAYAPSVASLADELVLVIRAGETPVAAVREALRRLGDHPVRGAVLNGQRVRSRFRFRRR